MAHYFCDNSNEDEDDRLKRLEKIEEVRCERALESLGVVFLWLGDCIDLNEVAREFSQASPQSIFMEDAEYANYRNVMEDPDFPLDCLIQALEPKLTPGFTKEKLQIDDAFVIHYNTDHADTTVKKHTDPSDVTVNLCLEARGVEGSSILFYGAKDRDSSIPCSCSFDCFATKRKKTQDDSSPLFRVSPRPGFAMVHFGNHPHETLPLRRGIRTNCVLTFRFSSSCGFPTAGKVT